MANFISEEDLASLVASAVPLLDDDHSGFNGYGDYKLALKTSPYQPGHIIYVDVDGFDKPPRRALVRSIKLERYNFEWVNHVWGVIEKKDGSGFARMNRHIKRGYVTRGYQKARALGLLPPDDE
jgi:hypothetical protein